MTVEKLFGNTPPQVKDAMTAGEFNLWCAMNSKPYRLAKHVWPDGAWEWDVEFLPGRPDGTIAYGTGQEDETLSTMAAFAFIAGVEWAEAMAAARAEAEAALGEDDEDDEPPSAPELGEEMSEDEPVPLVPPIHHTVQVADAAYAARTLQDEEAAAILGDDVDGETFSADVFDEASAPPPVIVEEEAAEDGDGYRPPPTDLLQAPPARGDTEADEAKLADHARMLETILRNFRVRGEIMEVKAGPVVTLYEFEPVPGTKSATVINLADDIARSMSAMTARVALVPGRSSIGIELPNDARESVVLREILAHPTYRDSTARLPLALGKDIGGEPVVVDLARMPHLLIAGTTGSGKSVGINAMILSLLFKLPPERCRVIMVDPKMLELSVYDGIPHLLTPVVTDPRKAVIALKWAVREMESRYRNMAALGVRNIEGYNERCAELVARGERITRQVQVGFDRETGEPITENQIVDLSALPYVVVIVDEMADLMLVAGKEIEAAIQRLAQMARAAGIHLIMATQRPSVDVITGTIKANFPTRVSFQVTSKIDSRTILGEPGAEQLLGQGDMLYMAAGGRITRVHGAFVSDSEVEKVVGTLKTQGSPDYLHAITEEDDDDDGYTAPSGGGAVFDSSSFGGGGGEGSEDDLYDQAVAVVLREQKVSVSFIQRHLQVGYNRSARIVERMEREGIVSQANHVGKREILAQASRYFAGRDE